MAMLVSSELRLVQACVLWPRSNRRTGAVRTAAQAYIDWHRFANLVNRHRVWGLVADGLAQARIDPPPEFAWMMVAKVAVGKQRSLVLALETIEDN